VVVGAGAVTQRGVAGRLDRLRPRRRPGGPRGHAGPRHRGGDGHGCRPTGYGGRGHPG
jgi:hypothetical protein